MNIHLELQKQPCQESGVQGEEEGEVIIQEGAECTGDSVDGYP